MRKHRKLKFKVRVVNNYVDVFEYIKSNEANKKILL